MRKFITVLLPSLLIGAPRTQIEKLCGRRRLKVRLCVSGGPRQQTECQDWPDHPIPLRLPPFHNLIWLMNFQFQSSMVLNGHQNGHQD
jgi:hypothetical protein